MAAIKWTPQDLTRLIVAGTGSLCLLILVPGLLLLTYFDKLTVAMLGSITGVGAGAGFLGLAYILFLIIRASMREAGSK